jgi:SP family arabinose:H+ symporter-like MFS transporter
MKNLEWQMNRTLSEDWLKLEVPLKGSVCFLSLICLVASMGGLLFGFDTAVISGTFGFVEKQFALSKLALGWFGSAALVGCIVGAVVAGWFGDRFGRKPVLMVAGGLFLASALCSAVPRTFALLVCARIIGGVGIGLASVLAPMYISEFAPPKVRGRLVGLYQLSIVIGILLAYYSNWALLTFSEKHPDALGASGLLHWICIAEVWRGMFVTMMIPSVAFLGLLLLVPESPRWLIEKGQRRRAFAILARIGGRATAEREMVEIGDALGREEGSLRELLQPGLRLALIIGIGLSVFGQMTGVNIVVYYGPTILEQAGLVLGSAMQYQVALGLINLVFTLIALWKVDSWGRRGLLIGGMVVVTLTLGITGVLFALKLTSSIWIVLALSAYMACEALSICGVIWILTPEIFPNRIRGRAVSIAVFANWATNAVSAFLFPWFVARFGVDAGFFVFAAICLVATVFFWRFVPETKGKSLEEIENLWRPKPNCHCTAR